MQEDPPLSSKMNVENPPSSSKMNVENPPSSSKMNVENPPSSSKMNGMKKKGIVMRNIEKEQTNIQVRYGYV
jgi:hypothetical protein